jgi:hypothetical protein
MIAPLAFPRDAIVYKRIAFQRPPAAAMSTENNAEWEDDEYDDDDRGDDAIEMPFPDDDPDWGFDDEEVQPEQGDFWLDSDDEEDAL